MPHEEAPNGATVQGPLVKEEKVRPLYQTMRLPGEGERGPTLTIFAKTTSDGNDFSVLHDCADPIRAMGFAEEKDRIV
jgi:hypothetical protein